MIRIISHVADLVVTEAALPDYAQSKSLNRIMRKAAFELLDRFADVVFNCEENMDVVRHHHELVKLIKSLAPLLEHYFDKKHCHALALQKKAALICL